MKGAQRIKGISRNVVFLGVVSGLTDVSSEMLYPILPLFLLNLQKFLLLNTFRSVKIQ